MACVATPSGTSAARAPHRRGARLASCLDGLPRSLAGEALGLVERSVRIDEAAQGQQRVFRLIAAADERKMDEPVANFNGMLWLALGVLSSGLVAAALVQVLIGLAPFGKLREALARVRGAACAPNAPVGLRQSCRTREPTSFEFCLNALRLVAGFDAELFEARTGLPWSVLSAPLAAARAKGLVMLGADRKPAPTALGRQFLNDLQAIFLPADPPPGRSGRLGVLAMPGTIG